MTHPEQSDTADMAADWMLERLEELRLDAGELLRAVDSLREQDLADPPPGGVSVLESVVDSIRRAEGVWRS